MIHSFLSFLLGNLFTLVKTTFFGWSSVRNEGSSLEIEVLHEIIGFLEARLLLSIVGAVHLRVVTLELVRDLLIVLIIVEVILLIIFLVHLVLLVVLHIGIILLVFFTSLLVLVHVVRLLLLLLLLESIVDKLSIFLLLLIELLLLVELLSSIGLLVLFSKVIFVHIRLVSLWLLSETHSLLLYSKLLLFLIVL